MAYSMAGSDRYAEPNEWQHGKTTAFKLGISKKPRVKDHVMPQRGVQGQWNGPLRTSPRGGGTNQSTSSNDGPRAAWQWVLGGETPFS